MESHQDDGEAETTSIYGELDADRKEQWDRTKTLS